MPFDIRVESKTEGVYFVTLDGRLDTGTYMLAEKKLMPLASGPAKVMLFNLAKLEYISSMGLRVILSARKTLEEGKGRGRVVLVKLQPQIAKVFELVDVLPKTSIFDSTESADIFLDAVQNRELNKNQDYVD